LTRYLSSSGTYESYTQSGARSIPDNSVFWIMEDHLGMVWIGTFNGIARFDVHRQQFIAYPSTQLLASPKVRAIVEDHRHRLWVATEGGGVSVLERQDGFASSGTLTKVQEFGYDSQNPNAITSDIVLTILEDVHRNIWLGTNNGLCRYNPFSGQMTRLTVETGFPDGLIMGLLNDNKGNVWASHKKGLTRISIDGEQMSFRNFTKEDGLPGSEFSQNAYFASADKLYFGGTAGLTVFKPDSLFDNPFVPQVAITGLRLRDKWLQVGESYGGRVVLLRSLLAGSRLELNYGERDFAIGFAALHYSNPMGNRFKYKLNGYDTHWIEAGASERVAAYVNLLPGKYRFMVMAANCDGLWNPEAAELEIVILPPWWLTWWAYLGYALVVLALLVVLVRFLLWRIKLKQQLAQLKVLIADRQKVHPEVVCDTLPQLNDPSVAMLDDAFVIKALAYVDANLERPDFSQDELAEYMGVSKRQLYRRIYALTGQTVHGFITTIRMEKAKSLLVEGRLTVSEVAYKVGFSEPSNFSRTFSKQYGESPSAFLKK
jgi:AraC-like DNA-binding protein